MLPTEHREKAISLLEAAAAHAVTSPARATVLAEAQVHATLSLAPAPVEFVFPDVPGGLTIPEDEPDDFLGIGPLRDHAETPSTPSPKPAPKKRPARPRKPASPKETS